ncbi:universal stress protein [Sphaerisporangium aureirubrum]|uniref:Universal stress protein n=1 Tax=Sphaerisporangium aureirubrum TaxID=1544736 RepID=A0ABW1NEI1_9ACTN
MSRSIVAGVDGSAPAAAAAEWAADEAARQGLPLRIVHVREPWTGEDEPHRDVPAGGDEPSTDVLAEAAGVARKRAPGVEVTTALLNGTVVASLRAESETAAMVVIGSRGLGGFAELLLGSVGMGLAGHARGPVVVVREPGARRGEIVAGYDGSPHAEAAMRFALEQAAGRGARVRVVFAWPAPPMPPYAIAYGDLVQEAFDAEANRVRERVADWRDEFPDVEILDEVVIGHPVPALTDASREADLVVVGSRGKGPLASLLGSVSHGVLHHAHCPVAVVRPPEEA